MQLRSRNQEQAYPVQLSQKIPYHSSLFRFRNKVQHVMAQTFVQKSSNAKEAALLRSYSWG